MIENILTLLSIDEFKGVSWRIDFAKGSRELPLTFRDAWKKRKRHG